MVGLGITAASAAYGAYNSNKQTKAAEKSANRGQWQEGAGMDLYDRAQEFADKPYTPYTGDMIAGLNKSQMQANQLAQVQPARFKEQFGNVSNIFNKSTTPYGQTFGQTDIAAGVNPQSIKSNRFDNYDIGGYINPYVKSVLDPQLADIREQGAIDQNSLNAKAGGTGNFGGSRQALLNDLLQRRTDKNLFNATNTAYSQAFNNAQNAFNTDETRSLAAQGKQADIYGQDITNKLYADKYNEDQALNTFKTNYDVFNGDRTAAQNAGKSLLDVINSKSNITNNNIANLEKTGGVNQATRQSLLDNQYKQFLAEQNYPREMTEYLSNILRGNPTSSGQAAAPAQNGLASNIGSGLQIAGALNNAYQSFGNSGGGGGSGGGSPFAGGAEGWTNPDTGMTFSGGSWT